MSDVQRMNMRQLEAFRAVLRAGSVSAASELLHMSQPSLSRLIADLESVVEFSLFTRGRRGMTPTVEGRRFHEAVERSFVGIDRLRDTARVIRNAQAGELLIGAIPSVAQTALPLALRRHQEIHPNQRVHITVGTTASIINAVLLNEVHIGIVGTTYVLEGVEKLFESTFEGVCLVPKGHDLATSAAPIDLRDLSEGEFVSFDRPLLEAMTLDLDLIETLLSKAMITSHSTPTLTAIARAMSRLAIVDKLTGTTTELLQGLLVRKIVQQTTHGLAVIKHPNTTLQKSATDFATEFRNELHRRKNSH